MSVAIFLAGNPSEGFAAYGPYPDWDTAADRHDGWDGWVMSVEPHPDDAGLATVVFQWSEEWGECYDCGLPAAFMVGPDTAFTAEGLRCAVCAAQAACEGETIRWLGEDGDGADLERPNNNKEEVQ